MRWLIIEHPGKLQAVVQATGRRKALKVIQKHHGGSMQHSGSRVPILLGSDLGPGVITAHSEKERPEFVVGGGEIYAE